MLSNIAATNFAEGINEMLLTIEENSYDGVVLDGTPFEDIDENTDIKGKTSNPDLISAHRLLLQCSIQVQTHGYFWNTVNSIKLRPSPPSHEISIPNGYLRVVPVCKYNGNERNKVIVIDDRLYNIETDSYDFAGQSVEVTAILGLLFKELPTAAKQYIVALSCQKFQARRLGSTTLYRFSEKDVEAARLEMLHLECQVGKYNILDRVRTVSCPVINSTCSYFI